VDSIASAKKKTMEGKGVGAPSLIHSSSGIKGRDGALGWGLGILTSKLITHTDMHKPNNKLINA
jgi:hypothetical protein